jgi:hypothetical protein
MVQPHCTKSVPKSDSPPLAPKGEHQPATGCAGKRRQTGPLSKRRWGSTFHTENPLRRRGVCRIDFSNADVRDCAAGGRVSAARHPG